MSHQQPTPEIPHNHLAQWQGQQSTPPQYMGGIPQMQLPVRPFKTQQTVARGITELGMLGILLGLGIALFGYGEEVSTGLVLIANSTVLVVLCSIWYTVAAIGNHLHNR